MTNYEHYKDKITEILSQGRILAIRNNKPEYCVNIACGSCDRTHGQSCDSLRKEWLNAEYQEVDWTKVPKNTPVLVTDFPDDWCKRYFAFYKNGKVYTYAHGGTEWSTNGVTCEWDYAKLAEDTNDN